MTVPATMDLGAKQLKVVRDMYPALEESEFNTFIEYCRRAGLDPFRKQISAIVFGAKSKDKTKRRVAFIVGIDGYRAMADRTGTYMPHEDAPAFVQDAKAKSDTNPLGLVSCLVKVKKFAHGAWHTYPATAYWDEVCPLEDEWKEDERTGYKKRTGKKKLPDNWKRMPRTMMEKCAWARALRMGWPDTFAGVYAEDELERERVLDLTASEIVEEAEREQREKMIGGPNAITLCFEGKIGLQRIADGKMVEHIDQWSRTVTDPAIITWFMSYNRESLQEFWARHKGDALQVKTILEDRLEELKAKAK